MQRTLITLVLFACLSILPGMARSVTELTGFSGGAFFRIVVPDETDPVPWNGNLVLWNHGFSLSPIGPVSDLGPLAALQLSQGYAVAASSYKQTGWAVFQTNNDLRAMVDVFRANFGEPAEIIVTGASLGGIVTVAAVEKGDLGNVTGAMTLCGAVGGSRNWDGGTDVRLTYDALCADVPGAFLPGGAEGLPADFDLIQLRLVLAVNACFGVPFGTSDPQQALVRFGRYLNSTQLPPSFVLTDMGFATSGLQNLVHGRGKLNGKVGVTNVGVTYRDPGIDATIERVTPNPGAANRLARNYTPSGAVGDVKIVSLHTDKDGLVIVENESEFASVVPASNLTTAIAIESGPSHCGFTQGEVVASWESLRGWVGGGSQPSAASIQGTCLFLEANGLVQGPCRVDPGFVIPDMDGRIPPR
ncbi:MAG: hypothetical protein OEM49_11405 [Myxococcales bacterium]|nr:hypothetical protein [Myxococcales bacterium]MDH5565655.1 hypothetical protein [Myxococcales bacterium]